MLDPAPTSNAPRLSELGDDAAAVLRIIAYFDAFDESAANADTVIRAAALLAECPAGATWPAGPTIRYDAAGRLLPAHPAAPTLVGPDPTVWLERPTVLDQAAHHASPDRAGRWAPSDQGEQAVPDQSARRGTLDRSGRPGPDGAQPRGAAPHPLDEVVLDRLRHCLRVVSARQVANPLRMDDPALLEVVLSEKERREDRVRAMRLLGLDPGRATRVLAVAGPGAAEAVRIIGEHVPIQRHAVIGATTAVLVQDLAPLDGRESVAAQGYRSASAAATRTVADNAASAGRAPGATGIARPAGSGGGAGMVDGVGAAGPGRPSMVDRGLSDTLNAAVVQAFPASQAGAVGPWIGVGERLPAYAAAASWEQARRALRFASSTWHGRRVIAFERLGALELLADLPVQRLLGTADVMRISEFAATEAGALAVDTLEAFCVFGTLRRTATELHLHHSTVAARIAQVEAVMGWDVDDALDRFTATLVLFVRRMALSSAQLSGPLPADPTSVGQPR
ncbi:helix-turn-helix domain-containing protein [Nocardia tengchongensis]|uniref:helix-turn-helix domain-containing protein n=1 Tax=Nocardia tengchongensis TaxID=2055889 RepID=UPI0036945894